jgi:GT2 family glycosyltransferase
VSPRLWGVLVTYRRPDDLRRHLEVLATQTRPPDHLVLVDNAPCEESEHLLEGYRAAGLAATYLPSPENLGAAGGIAAGMREVLSRADDEDWLVSLDDDNPPRRDDLLARLTELAVRLHRRDPAVAGTGVTGARFDWRRARLRPFDDGELVGDLAVDYVGGNQFPTLLVGALRRVGTFRADLFWGLDDLEFGLRLRRAGYRLVVAGELARWAREYHGRVGRPHGRVSAQGRLVPWRRYYTLRNLVFVLRWHGRDPTAARVALVRGLGKATAIALRHPGRARVELGVTVAAIRDGWAGRLGRRMEPGATRVGGPAVPAGT